MAGSSSSRFARRSLATDATAGTSRSARISTTTAPASWPTRSPRSQRRTTIVADYVSESQRRDEPAAVVRVATTWSVASCGSEVCVFAHRCIDSYVVWTTDARAVLLHGLADRSRLSLIEQLLDGPRPVGELVESTGLTQSNASRHLACLYDCGLVERERRGREVHYRLVDGIAALLQAADGVLGRTGDRVMACPRYGRPSRKRAA